MPSLTLYMNESLCCCLLYDSVVHPHSLYRFSNDTDLVMPVIINAYVPLFTEEGSFVLKTKGF